MTRIEEIAGITPTELVALCKQMFAPCPQCGHVKESLDDPVIIEAVQVGLETGVLQVAADGTLAVRDHLMKEQGE